MQAREANFDGLVGPTHNYAGLSVGNLASEANLGRKSNPRAAALQGLEKMKALHDRGYWQGVLPPLERPDIPALRRLGFAGSDAQVLAAAAREPILLAACSSASSMWTANAATVSPSADTADGRVHFTPANLVSKLHRALEPEATGTVLQRVFADDGCFVHHPALPAHESLGDEGAANHTRFATAYGQPGVEFFVYGKHGARPGHQPQRFVARQTRLASEAIARLHGLEPERTVFAQQAPAVIDAGVFHNDVIAVGNLDVLFCHEQAFDDQGAAFGELERALGCALKRIVVPRERVSVEDAVRTYLFNSQLLADGDKHLLLAPSECAEDPAVAAYLDELVGTSPIHDVLYMDLRQSMHNGGGPACLRLRVVLTEAERAAVAPGVWLDDEKYVELRQWVTRHYRDALHPDDLADPALLQESQTALDELTQLLGLGAIYPFQA